MSHTTVRIDRETLRAIHILKEQRRHTKRTTSATLRDAIEKTPALDAVRKRAVMEAGIRLSVRLDPATHAKLSQWASIHSATKSEVVREVLCRAAQPKWAVVSGKRITGGTIG